MFLIRNGMKKIFASVLIHIVLVFSLLATPAFGVEIKNGVLDATAIHGVVKLQGEVEFYWNQLLEPSHFKDSAFSLTPIMGKIPKSWTTYKLNGSKLPAKGFGTYRFVVSKNPDKACTLYGLKLATVFTSYKVWANGQLVAEVGRVGRTPETSVPAFKYHDIPIVMDPAEGATDRIEFVMQVSNFSHQRSGLAFAIHFGKYQDLLASSRSMDILNLIIIGIILVIGINHLILYFLRRKDVSNLYFGIVCLVMILRNLTTADRVITYIIPGFNWELLFKLDNFSGFGTIPLFALFVYSLFKEDFPKAIKNTLVIIGLVISLFVFVTPAIVYGKFRMFFEVYILIGGLYLAFGVLLVSAFRRRPYALATFLGMFILYSTAINDVLSSMGIIQTAYVAPYGLVGFMFIQSLTINRKSARAINQNEEISTQLIQEKENLEVKIEERTRELTTQHEELLKHQEKEKEQNWINNGITHINEVMSRDKDNLRKLSHNVLSALLKYIDARMGAIFIAVTEDNEQYLEMVADYGCSRELKEANAKIPANSGLVGAVFTENEMQILTDIPDDHLKIGSGLGNARPKALLIVPLTHDEQTLGVIELATFNDLREVEIEFIKRVASTVANTLNTVKMNEENLKLIARFKDQNELLRANEEDIRQKLEELQVLEESLHSRNVEIEKINEEIQRKNKEIEDFKSMMLDIVDQIPGKIYVKDPEGRIVFVNSEVARYYPGKTVNDLIGTTDFDHFDAKVVSKFWEKEKQIIESGIPEIIPEDTVIDKDGNTRIFKSYKVPFFIKTLGTKGLLGFQVDITEMKAFEAEASRNRDELAKLGSELAQDRLLLSCILTNSPEIIFFKDTEGIYRKVSSSMLKICKLDKPDDAIGKTDFDLFAKNTAEQLVKLDQQAIASGNSTIAKIKVHESGRKDDFMVVSKTPIMDTQGKTIGILGFTWLQSQFEDFKLRTEREVNPN